VTWEAERRYGGGQAAPDVVFVRKPTLELNPTFDADAVRRAFEEDPASAAAEYGAEFRADVEGFVAQEAVDAAVVPGRLELPAVAGVAYRGFLDFAGGKKGGDSAALALAHAEDRGGRSVVVLDVLREVRPPFSPERTCREFAATLRAYG